jgi:hypothetical protein
MPEGNSQTVSRVRAWIRRNWPWVAVVGVSIFLVAESQGTAEEAQRAAHQATMTSAALKAGLIESCEVNGNPLREVLQSVLKGEVAESKHIPAKFFPDIPPELFHQLLRIKREANEEKIKRIEPVDCVAQYSGSHP